MKKPKIFLLRRKSINFIAELYYLYFEDKETLQSPMAWLNDRSIDAAQELKCNDLEADDNYQSILNVQKRQDSHHLSLENEHIQLLYNGSGL